MSSTVTAPTTHIHPRSVADKVRDAWRSPDRFTKNPDLIRLPNGRLLFVYSDTDAHWAQESEVLTLIASDDDGQTWFKFKEVAKAVQPQDERLVTPRLSRLSDGRLVIICDHNDFHFFHEDQGHGNWLWWSEDEGETWSDAQVSEIEGFEPDRVMELADGSLAVCTHLMLGASQELADIISVSTDGGKSWHRRGIIAHDGHHRFCEGALVHLQDGALACVLRENHSNGIPCFVAFSYDNGYNWTAPQMLPCALHRPYAKQLPDGRVLVTGRHVNGGVGTYAWCGDLHAEAGRWAVGGPRWCADITLDDDGLHISNQPEHDARYTLLPPQDATSDVTFTAKVRVEGEGSDPVAIISIANMRWGGPGTALLYICPDSVCFTLDRPDKRKAIDMTVERTVTLRHRRGQLEVLIDGKAIMWGCNWGDQARSSNFHGNGYGARSQFGQYGDSGRSHWRSVSYEVFNKNLPAVNWHWSAADGELPDQYQRERLIQIHSNSPFQGDGHRPDHGYSSWEFMPDGSILLVDYTNSGDQYTRSHVVAVNLQEEDYR